MDVEVSQEDQRCTILREGAEQGVKLIEEAPQGTWRAINNNNVQVNGGGD